MTKSRTSRTPGKRRTNDFQSDKKRRACGTCNRRVRQLRSAWLRPNVAVIRGLIREHFPDPARLSDQEFECYDDAREKLIAAEEFTREFICNDCYDALDTQTGFGRVQTPRGPQTIELHGRSRKSRAPQLTAAEIAAWEKRNETTSSNAKYEAAVARMQVSGGRAGFYCKQDDPDAIPCAICNQRAKFAWSIQLRNITDILRRDQGFRAARERIDAEQDEQRRDAMRERFAVALDAGDEAWRYRRAFVCDWCYLSFDTDDRYLLHEQDGTANQYEIGRASLFGRAAVYDVRMWRRYQRKQAEEMGWAYAADGN